MIFVSKPPNSSSNGFAVNLVGMTVNGTAVATPSPDGNFLEFLLKGLYMLHNGSAIVYSSCLCDNGPGQPVTMGRASSRAGPRKLKHQWQPASFDTSQVLATFVETERNSSIDMFNKTLYTGQHP